MNNGKLLLFVGIGAVVLVLPLLILGAMNWMVVVPDFPEADNPGDIEVGVVELGEGSREGDLAFDFTLPDIEGNLHSLRDYRGQVVVLNFWSTGCSYCLVSLPSLAELQKKDGVQVVAVNYGDTPAVLKELWEQEGYEVFTLLDDGTAVAKYQVRGIPDTLIIDAEGIVRARFLGARPPEELRRAVAAAQG